MTRFVIFCMALAACGTSVGQKQTERLIESSTGYQEGMRWGRFEDAAAYVPPEERDGFLDERDRLGEDLRIDDYEVLRVHMQNGHKAARVRVKYTWHLDSVGRVFETVTEQKWARHGQQWLLEEEIVQRGEAMPGMPEKLPEESPGDKAPEESAP
jgi:hypothetical protein